MTHKILVINGPNLNLLGTREKEKYGQSSLRDINTKCEVHAKKLGLSIEFKQSNVEGEIVNFIQEAKTKYSGIIINAGGYTHTSVAILDALLAVKKPTIELHITNIYKREDFRHKSLISKAADGIICGLGADGYIMALDGINKKLNNYQIISCPGCHPTSILLPLVPLVKNKLIKTDNIIIDSKSGYSGAGRGVHKKYKNKNLYESLSAYGISLHRHNSEILQELKLYTKKNIKFTFTPHLTPMFRGILSTIYIDLNKNINQNKIINVLKRFYKGKTFIKVANKDALLSTNEVIGTNKCIISVCKSKYKDKIIILSAIDNLIKGGSGQAIQNMNLRFGFKESEGIL